MSDRELLEMAAKAAGLKEFQYINGQPAYRKYQSGLQDWVRWSPLDDDGDEARLEAALMMHVEWHPLSETVFVGRAVIGAMEQFGNDRQAARRRAGVRAAAEIGRTM